MFSQDREQLRQAYHDTWQKMQTQQPLTALEQQLAHVIAHHPEYHPIFQQAIEKDFATELGDTNPYLHMGLHLALYEQIATNRPKGIQRIYHQLIEQFSSEHDASHHMMNCLSESLWLAQQHQTQASEVDYLSALQQLVKPKK